MNTQLVKSVARTFAAAALAAAPLAATQVRAEQNTLYYCGGTDAAQTSSLTGTGASQGWAETPGGTRMYAGMQSNATHVVFGDGVIRTVIRAVTASTAAPSGSTLVFSNCLGSIAMNIPQYVSVPTVTIGSLEVVSGSEVQLPVWGGIKDSSAPGGFRRAYPTWAGDDWFIETGSSVKFQLNTACWAGFNCTAVIRGGAGSSLKAETVHYDTGQFTLVSNTLRLSGNLSGYSGDLVVGSVGDQPGFARMELVNEYSIPSDPPVAQTAYVVVTNGATLIVDQDWTSGRNRVWDFGSGEPSTIYVAEGKTVTIKGEVRGSVGFRKSGPGMLVLGGGGPLSGTCEVLSGKVRLEGGAVAFRRLFRPRSALALPSGYAMLDYIDLSGANTNSCIDTGYVPKDQDFGFMLDTSLSGLPTSLSYWFMGSSWLSSTYPYYYGIGCATRITANDCLQLNFGYSGTSRSYWPMRSPEISNGTRFRMSLLTRQGESSLGESHAFEKGLSYNFSGSVFVGFINFTSSSSLSREKTQPMHIYRFKLFDGNTLVHDFVPVARKSDGLLGLYDTFGDKGFRRVFDQSCAASGGAYSGSDSVWIEVGPGPGSVYYIR